MLLHDACHPHLIWMAWSESPFAGSDFCLFIFILFIFFLHLEKKTQTKRGIVVFCVALHVQQTLEPLFTVSRADKTARARWIANLQLGADAVKPYSRLCSRHFPGGDPSKEPQLKPGKTFFLS